MSKVFPVPDVVDEAVKLGERISGFSKLAVAAAKEAVNVADNLPLDQGEEGREGRREGVSESVDECIILRVLP